MKKFLLFGLIFSVLVGCNQPAKKQISSLPSEKFDTSIVNKSKDVLTFDLTADELKDDSVFVDGSEPGDWASAGFTDVKGFKVFLKQLQLLVMDNNKIGLSKLIKYPLHNTIKSEKDFIENYDTIFTKDVKLEIAKINFSQIFRNYKGAMTDAGRVWFAQDEAEFKIIAVNF